MLNLGKYQILLVERSPLQSPVHRLGRQHSAAQPTKSAMRPVVDVSLSALLAQGDRAIKPCKLVGSEVRCVECLSSHVFSASEKS